MDNQDVGSSILAKFQQINSEKEIARHASESAIPFGKCTSSDADIISNKQMQRRKRKTGDGSNRKNSENELHIGLSEKEVGIVEYYNNTPQGFTGIIKHRYSDFQVHEIDLEGNVIELKSLAVPELSKESDSPEEPEPNSVLSEDIWKKIEEVVTSSDENAVTEIDVTNKSKDERRLIHKAVKHVYGAKVNSTTITKDEKSVVAVRKSRSKDRVCWPKSLPNRLHFTLFKENVDTTNAISTIAQRLGMKTNSITYCGTKDKRGKTTQRMCVNRRRAEDLQKLNLRQIKLGDYCYKDKSLKLGDLSGNKFEVAIRNVKSSDDEINTSLNFLKDNGFINYYGLQRFGSSSLSPTFEIGKAILLKDWKKAIELILKPRNGEKNSAKSHLDWNTKDGAIEKKVLKALQKSKKEPNQYLNALFAIPRNTMLLYVHAYQSLIWNKLVSKRIKEFGLKPLVGDLLHDEDGFIHELEEDGEIYDVDNGDDEDNKQREDDEHDNKQDKDAKNVSLPGEKCKQKVKIVTAEDLDQVNFENVVLPLPGCDIEYPDNVVHTWYNEFLAEDGLSLESFKDANPAFALFGSYRRIVGKVHDLTWKITYYNSVDDDLILSDIDRLENKSLTSQSQESEFKAVILDFKLKPSLYATMLLREIMRCDTSVFYHAGLTKSIRRKKEEEPDEKRKKQE